MFFFYTNLSFGAKMIYSIWELTKKLRVYNFRSLVMSLAIVIDIIKKTYSSETDISFVTRKCSATTTQRIFLLLLKKCYDLLWKYSRSTKCELLSVFLRRKKMMMNHVFLFYIFSSFVAIWRLKHIYILLLII